MAQVSLVITGRNDVAFVPDPARAGKLKAYKDTTPMTVVYTTRREAYRATNGLLGVLQKNPDAQATVTEAGVDGAWMGSLADWIEFAKNEPLPPEMAPTAGLPVEPPQSAEEEAMAELLASEPAEPVVAEPIVAEPVVEPTPEQPQIAEPEPADPEAVPETPETPQV